MNSILFFDLEADEKSEQIRDIGAIYDTLTFYKTTVREFEIFGSHALFLCGHNILAHDLPLLKKTALPACFLNKGVIDTLYLSTLLFPEKPYHRLVKDYKILTEEINNPLADATLAKELYIDIVEKFHSLPSQLGDIYYYLLSKAYQFKDFFLAINYIPSSSYEFVPDLIKKLFEDKLCVNAPFAQLIEQKPILLAYALAISSTKDSESIIPPWLLHTFPTLNDTLYRLRVHRCKDDGCNYCQRVLSPQKALQKYFRYEDFRKFEGDGEISLQEKVVRCALNNQSLLAIFPTGGGKSLTFQLPALMMGEANRALTVVIAPLQSLMKDQVDVLLKRFEVTGAVTINGLLSPLERSEALERVASGGAHILYISPEALRSKTIFELLVNRSIARFVIDEAHCFSSWGQDFRVDYLYIGEFLDKLQKAKNLSSPIPVSCFTATAKPAVIEDICSYFQKKLNIRLNLFRTGAKRVNLSYCVEESKSEIDKYQKLLNLLSQNDEPKIVYVARTKTAEKLSQSLKRDGFKALPYHGQMESKVKIQYQEDFMDGKIDVIVATTAFGMGVDKDNVKMVIHFDISDSLENYVQEAGRAGRKADLQASCYVLFDENDLNKHFALLTQSKLNRKEIASLWSGIKKLTEYRSKVSKSALELAKAAGWDMEMMQLETRITSALAALEDCGYLKREQNAYRIFANSFLIKDINKVNEIINQSTFILEKDKEHAIRIVQRIIKADETRVDYLSETLAIPKEDIMRVLGFLRHEGIIGDAKDLTAFIDQSSSDSGFVSRFNRYAKIEKKLLSLLPLPTGIVHLKEINEKLTAEGIKDISIDAIKDILNFWQIRNYIHKERLDKSLYTYSIKLKKDSELFRGEMEKRIILANAITDYLSKKLLNAVKEEASDANEILLEFSVLELQKEIEKAPAMFDCGFSLTEYEEALLYLNAISALKLEGGFLVLYKPMVIERVEEDRKKRYTENEYEKLASFYKNKTQQIHIVGEYAKKMIANYGEALQFTDDYFTLEYNSFLKKYFPKRLHEISRPLTPEKFKAIFGTLSPEQLEIINDNKSEHILVAAGPGSGKTRVLVHKVASLLMLEDIKPEGFLMLTFSRAAALEFKERLHALIGNVAYYIDIHTYHSYCFNLMGRVGSLEKSDTVISECIEQIVDGIIPESKIGIKNVLVVDEFQDINEQESRLLTEIISRGEKIRVLVVGDDDQNIYEFRGSSVKYMQNFELQNKARRYELITNFRSKQNLVAFANGFVATIPHRMKNEHIVAKSVEDGNICIHQYTSSNLFTPLINNIASTELSGTTAVLTATNREATLIESLLKGKGLPARRILSHEGFSLSELLEIKSFTNLLKSTVSPSSQIIAEDVWQGAKQTIIEEHKQSKNLWLFAAVTSCYEKNYTRKIIFEWRLFLTESRFEDFYYPEKNIITVSTMHKAKGKEFDNVFLLLDEFEIKKDADRRIIYVAITRAKQNLIIHTNTSQFNRLHVSNLKIFTDNALYTEPKDLHLYLNHRDVFLNCFKQQSVIYTIDKMCAGEKLHLEKDGYTLTNSSSKKVGVLSKEFQKTLKKHNEDGYRIKDIEVDFIVYWNDVADNGEYKILLPKFVLTKLVNHAIFSR